MNYIITDIQLRAVAEEFQELLKEVDSPWDIDLYDEYWIEWKANLDAKQRLLNLLGIPCVVAENYSNFTIGHLQFKVDK